MTDTLIDTNVLLDVNGPESDWKSWSMVRLAEAADRGFLVINQVIYAELAAGYARMEDVDTVFTPARFQRESVPWEAAFMAGIAFLEYRRRGGPRVSPLPDFFIGAHAAVRGYRLLTRDRGYYTTCFPTLDVVTPETQP